jgi:hypothetical protein
MRFEWGGVGIRMAKCVNRYELMEIVINDMTGERASGKKLRKKVRVEEVLPVIELLVAQATAKGDAERGAVWTWGEPEE